jgi:hypothetical protein
MLAPQAVESAGVAEPIDPDGLIGSDVMPCCGETVVG